MFVTFLVLMRNPFMKFQYPIKDLFRWTDRRTDDQAQSNMPLQLFQSWGHNLKFTEIYSVCSYLFYLFACWVILLLCCRLLIFFKINFFKIFFQEYYQSVKQFGSRSGPKKCRSWSGSKLFAKVISRQH